MLAMAGFFADPPAKYCRNHSPHVLPHYKPWWNRASQAVGGSVGYVDAVAMHLYHGDKQNRQYRNRHNVLREHGFDPARHLERNSDGMLSLSDACPIKIRNWLSDYMLHLRREP